MKINGNNTDLIVTAMYMVARNDIWEHHNIKCYQYKKMGNYASSCLEKSDKDERVQLLMDRFDR